MRRRRFRLILTRNPAAPATGSTRNVQRRLAHCPCEPHARNARVAFGPVRSVPIEDHVVPTVVHLAYADRQEGDAAKIVSKLNRLLGTSVLRSNPLGTTNVSRLQRLMRVSRATASQYSTYIKRGRDIRFRFVLDRVVLPAVISGSIADREATASLSPKPEGTGLKHYLHVWVVQSTDYLGIASFPWETESESYDGVTIDYRTTLTRFAYQPYHQNKTLVHEVGHWLGLLHTFSAPDEAEASFEPVDVNENGQLDPQEQLGDLIPDTAPQAVPNFGNPFRTRSFPLYNGRLTPFMNYMDYVDDPAALTFSLQQRIRAQAMWNTYRRD